MRQVDACDFCGDAPDGVFEVVPAAVSDGPVRLALCSDCRTTLETVVDPLLAADASDATTGQVAAEDAEPSSQAAGDAETDAAEAAPDAPAAVLDSGGEDESGDTTDDSSGDAPTDSDDDGITIEERGGGTPVERPDGYAQVLRLLENRDGGMPRGDLRALATNAYDLTERTFETAVDAAVENGDVEEGADGLRRT